MSVNRSAGYFPLENCQLFSWLHLPKASNSVTDITIICPPLGHDYMSTYRTLRVLADSLAEKQIACIRLDYANNGNSSDLLSVKASVSDYVENIVDVYNFLRSQHPKTNIHCIGLGLGGTFAFLAAQKVAFSSLTLWEPCLRGKRFIRELKALSGMLSNPTDRNQDIEAVGLHLTARFEEELMKTDLREINSLAVENILWLYRDEVKNDASFFENLKKISDSSEAYGFSGYSEMTDIPTDTIIPKDTISKITSYIQEHCYKKQCTDELSVDQANWVDKKSFTKFESELYEESLHMFGPAQSLFGVLCKPSKPGANDSPLVVFLNCGSEHNVGPHRTYTNYARKLAALGVSSLRIDIEGIGDSVSSGRNEDNFSYSPVVLEDITYALEYAKELGFEHFALTGICAGAYHSFKAMADLPQFDIQKAILINPLVFDWESTTAEAISERIRNFNDAGRYKKNAFSKESWKKLIKGKVNPVYVLKAFGKPIQGRLKKSFNGKQKRELNIIEQRLERIINSKKRITMILAQDDPGFKLINADARRSVQKCIKEGSLDVHYVAGADHGISKAWMREEVFSHFKDALTR